MVPRSEAHAACVEGENQSGYLSWACWEAALPRIPSGASFLAASKHSEGDAGLPVICNPPKRCHVLYGM